MRWTVLVAVVLVGCGERTVKEGAPGVQGPAGERGAIGARGLPGAPGQPGKDGSSVLAVELCGLSEPTTGDLGGYTGAKALCADVCDSDSAHMCSGHEAAIAMQRGELGAGFWAAIAPGYRDCVQWQVGTDAVTGSVMWAGEIVATCDEELPVACCD